MGEHLSALALDHLAADLPVDSPASGHLATCAACRGKLDALKAERAALMKAPPFNALLNRLAPQAPRRSMPRWVPMLVAMAAAVLVVVVGVRFVPREEPLLKGRQTIELLKDGETPVTQARVGERLSIAVGGAGHTQVAVFSVDEMGKVAVLLPSTALATGARVPIGSAFEVTPGSLAVFACFSDHPLPVDILQSQIFNRGVQAKTAPREAEPPDGCAKASLEVVP